MVSMLVYSNNTKELQSIKNVSSDLIAYLSEEKWENSLFSSLEEVKDFLENHPLINLTCFDVVQNGSMDVLKSIRAEYKDMLLLLIADTSLSPMEYVNPEIMATSLLIRPYTMEVMKDKLKEFFLKYLSDISENDPTDAFVVDTKEGKTRIPYNQILYMEAREKKIYVRIQNKEIAFYGTLEELEETLSGRLVRCHRSFLVNPLFIEQIYLSQNEIRLLCGVSVPLSRSYKPHFKRIGKGK